MHPFTKPARWATAAACALLALVALPAPAANAGPASPAGPAADAPRVPDRYARQRLDWGPCASGAPALECASMAVPRDWNRPGAGPSLTLAVSRHRAPDPAARRGVLVVAAGGPGASGLNRPAGLASYAPQLAAAYDIAGFDQRGIGASTRVVCGDQDAVDALFTSGDLRDRSERAVRDTVARARAFVRDCRRGSGELLPYLTTDQAVRDLDLYRALLGADKVSYYGPSYASLLGAAYASRFPHRVDRVVLDSVIDPSGTWEEFMTGQPLSFQRRFDDDFLPWLAANDATYHQGRTPEEAGAGFERVRAALSARPLDLEGTVVTANHLDAAAASIVYNGGGFPDLAALLGVLRDPDHADPSVRRALAAKLRHPLAADFAAAFFSYVCADTPWTRSTRYWIDKSAADTRTHPLAGARELTFASICAEWPRPSTARTPAPAAAAPPVLLLNSLHDPATYYEGALRAHRALAGSRLITVGGGDHGNYQGKNPCVDAYVEDFLLRGRLPAADASCAAKPLPGRAAPAAAG
ncbi:alpha/beta hydrolase [Streptomyces sp. NBC_01565]|uniref:alpha/beta hydrolase n=1 Tax=unclassified Streptomyces TaxID=2593676 RepID=UPI002252AF0C|nr:alpha/beta hydrolase [Streptomyces sp. NBC_01565]MCX4546197.1 alpha/beta hydrolase [Streptomyces sp. NBC_01565]